MKYLAKVNAKYFAAATVFMAKEDVRYYLCGVCIQPHPEGGAAIVATNGHAMFVIRDPDAEVEREVVVCGISRQLVTACKGSKAGHVYIMADPDGRTTEDTHQHQPGAAMVVTLPEDGEDQGVPHIWSGRVLRIDQIKIPVKLKGGVFNKYPNWRGVCKYEPENAKPVSLQTKYLAKPEAAVQMILGKKASHITIYQQGGRQSVFFRVSSIDDPNLENLLMVIMPVRDDHTDSNPVRKELVELPRAWKRRVKYSGENPVKTPCEAEQ